ncbi:L-arabinose isomerase [Granulicella tundricola]|uniref:L-arabinose isomerase n=1 Tax=Granulicella tundricola (strain ATCC BAA-1859 / DSM 23138 / MP5ACTX9) TaxID=1198114 RepID=E8X4F6_GRATM|nr:L-arabinose isomerase [Granulicella tundricola]ADW68283.1 L-arabinose isomerase [Granulicella tundricola MP5ACTX9]
MTLDHLEVWFVTGSQHLYGAEALAKVAENSQKIAASLNAETGIPVKVVFKPVLTTADEITELCREANNVKSCIGLVLWMHTFSPAKMWIAGLKSLTKPFLHLHTQFNRELPWATIDMDFMNLNQAAHGDREFGFITSRLKLPRKVVVGFWQDAVTVAEIAAWTRAAAGWYESQNLKVVRFGDNMRDVAVTDGNKVSAEAVLGYSVNGYGVMDLVDRMNQFGDAEVDQLVAEYRDAYTITKEHDRVSTLRSAAKIELGIRAFLVEGGYGAFTDTFQDLHGLDQLPGIAVQRLMADGYGFAGEGDWKTAALVRTMKVMALGMTGGTSFMEDYTYDFSGTPKILGSHMLEICPSIAADKPSLEVHALGIGGKGDPARLVFTAPDGPAVCASIVEMSEGYRLIVNEVDVIQPEQALPKLPVARAVWVPRPSLKVAAAAWIYAGGAHHTCFSQALTTEHLEDFAEIAGIEMIVIDADTKLRELRRQVR